MTTTRTGVPIDDTSASKIDSGGEYMEAGVPRSVDTAIGRLISRPADLIEAVRNRNWFQRRPLNRSGRTEVEENVMNTTTVPTVATGPMINGYDPRTGYLPRAEYAAYATPAPRPAAAPIAAPTAINTAARLDQVRYWVGAGITAVIAALASLVALVIAQGIVHVPVVIGSGTSSTAVHAAIYGVCAAGIGLLAAALYDGMLQVAPRPLTYYSWIASIVTVLAGLLPFTSTAGLHSQIALSATNVAVGLIITLLVPIAASNARRTR